MHGVLGVYDLPIWASLSFTIFVVIVITNGFNLIDGIDGLAGGDWFDCISFIWSCCLNNGAK